MKPLPNPSFLPVTKPTPAAHARAAPHLPGVASARGCHSSARTISQSELAGRSKAFDLDSVVCAAWALATKVESVPINHQLPIVFPSASPLKQNLLPIKHLRQGKLNSFCYQFFVSEARDAGQLAGSQSQGGAFRRPLADGWSRFNGSGKANNGVPSVNSWFIRSNTCSLT